MPRTCTAPQCPWHPRREAELPVRKRRKTNKQPLRYNAEGAPCHWCARTKSSGWQYVIGLLPMCDFCAEYNRQTMGYMPGHYEKRWVERRDRFRPAQDEWAAGLVNEDGTMKEEADSEDGPPSPSEEYQMALLHVRNYILAHREQLERRGVEYEGDEWFSFEDEPFVTTLLAQILGVELPILVMALFQVSSPTKSVTASQIKRALE